LREGSDGRLVDGAGTVGSQVAEGELAGDGSRGDGRDLVQIELEDPAGGVGEGFLREGGGGVGVVDSRRGRDEEVDRGGGECVAEVFVDVGGGVGVGAVGGPVEDGDSVCGAVKGGGGLVGVGLKEMGWNDTLDATYTLQVFGHGS